MWQKLIDVLEEVRQGYQELLNISREKRAVLVAVDMKGLETVIEKEQKVLDRIHKAEKQRQAVLKQLAQTQLDAINGGVATKEIAAQKIIEGEVVDASD